MPNYIREIHVTLIDLNMILHDLYDLKFIFDDLDMKFHDLIIKTFISLSYCKFHVWRSRYEISCPHNKYHDFSDLEFIFDDLAMKFHDLI